MMPLTVVYWGPVGALNEIYKEGQSGANVFSWGHPQNKRIKTPQKTKQTNKGKKHTT